MPPIAYWIHKYLWVSLDWLFPPYCTVCDEFGYRFCDTCLSKVVRLEKNTCSICGIPMRDTMTICEFCSSNPPYFDQCISWAYYKEPLRRGIHHLKYKRDMALGEFFSGFLIDTYKKNGWSVHAVVPVPLSSARKIERGYNQSALLAIPLALKLDIPYKSSLLTRNRETSSQVGLSKAERHTNVEDAFSVSEDCSKYHAVLVIDDVMTTGATMNACAKVLKQAGVRHVYGLTLARAGITPDDDFMII